MLGITRTPSPKALEFGSLFHTAVLEPAQYRRTEARQPWQQIEQLATAVRRQRFCRDLLFRGVAEQSYTATHDDTGLTVKVRPDLLITSPKTGRRVVVDFKTTSCQDYAAFCGTIEQYDYDRQAALYSDVLGAARFVIIGMQKRAPFEVWQVEVTAAPGLIEQGRKKYTRLIHWLAQRPSPARPTPRPTRQQAVAHAS